MKKIIPPEKTLGQSALKLGKSYHISVRRLAQEIAFAMSEDSGDWKKEGVNYEEDTAYGYLHGNTWPKMPCETAIGIIQEAFQRALSPENYKKAQEEIAAEIKEIYSKYNREHTIKLTTETVLEYLLDFHHSKKTRLVKQYIDACSSLTADDMKLLKFVADWTEKQIREFSMKWKNIAGARQVEIPRLYDDVTSSAFTQWVTMRGKNHSGESAAPRKISKELSERLRKMTTDELKSIIAVINYVDGEGKHPLFFPEEIDLLLLFKYFLTDKQRAAMLEEAENGQ